MLMHFNDPFRTMDMLFDAMRPAARSSRGAPNKQRVDDEERAFVLRADLPGGTSEQLEVKVGEDWVEIAARRKLATPEGYEARHREREGFAISRRVRLPKRIDPEGVEAKLVDGSLELTLPKHASAQPRRITIQAA